MGENEARVMTGVEELSIREGELGVERAGEEGEEVGQAGALRRGGVSAEHMEPEALMERPPKVTTNMEYSY